MYIVYSAMCLIFGTTFLAIKVGVNVGAPPFLFAGARFFTAGLIVLLAVKLCGRSITLPKGHYKSIFIVGLFMTALMFGCLYWGEQYISSSLAALLAATTPLMIGLVEWFQGVKEYSLIRGSGLLISFLGVSIALLPALMLEATPYAFLAVIVILLAEVGNVFGTMTAQKLLAANISPFTLNGWQMVIGGTLLMLLSLGTESFSITESTDLLMIALLYLIFLGSLGGHGAYYWLVGRAGMLLPSTWTYVSPVIAQFVGYYILGEALSFYSFIGLILVLSGVLFVSKPALISKKYQQLRFKKSQLNRLNH